MDNFIRVGSEVMIMRKNKILLGHSVAAENDFKSVYETDTWCLPGGLQTLRETIYGCAERTVKEKTGLDICHLHIFGADDDVLQKKHFVTIQVIAEDSSGEALAMKMEHQDSWQWFWMDELPKKIHGPSEKFIRAFSQKDRARY
jgi:8-oxo-dGTP diphosphatase